MNASERAANEAERQRLVQRAQTGLKLTETQRQALSTRLMLQAPGPTRITVRQLAAIRADLDSRVAGLPPGAFMALDALRLLADQGNQLAADLFDSECRKLGLTRPFITFGR